MTSRKSILLCSSVHIHPVNTCSHNFHCCRNTRPLITSGAHYYVLLAFNLFVSAVGFVVSVELQVWSKL